MENQELKNILEAKLEEVNDTLLKIDCGDVAPETLPMKVNFYVAKKESLERLLWLLKIESRVASKAFEANDAEN